MHTPIYPNDIVLNSIHPRCVDTPPSRFLEAAASQLPSPEVRSETRDG